MTFYFVNYDKISVKQIGTNFDLI